MVTNNTIKGLQQRIVKALETGQDAAPILKELAKVRANIAAEADLAELQKVANERQALRGKVEAIKVKVQKQGEAIDAFLKARDTLVSQLKQLLEPMGELAKMGSVTWEQEPGPCYIFNSRLQFKATVNRIPEGYLPPDIGCPFLQIEGGKVDARGKAAEANKYFMSALDILVKFTKGISASPSPLRPTEGLMAVDNEPESDGETAEVESSCRVCQHREREAIDKALREGKSLRTIEAEFNVSRSTLHRHKAHLEV